MRKRKTVQHIFLFLIVFFNAHPSFGAEKWALLIGIDDYSLSAGFSNLKGPQNDIEIMKNVLAKERFGFTRITVLQNEQATHSRIEKAFKRLADRVSKEKVETVYIYYSGHGSKTRDLNKDYGRIKDLHGNPLYGYDRTWVTYGSRLKKGVRPPQGFTDIDHYDIMDDQISAWLNNIADRCHQVVFVSDSCHSGSVAESGISAGIRKGPIDRREHPLGRKTYKQSTSENIIRIDASKDNLVAREFIPERATEVCGVFTWYWAEALERCRPNETWIQMFNQMDRILGQETPNRQNPQIFGAVNMKIFGSDFFSPMQTIPVYKVLNGSNEKRVYLGAGSLSGVTKGSVYTLKKRAGQPHAPKITVIKANTTHSIAETTANVKVYDQLIEISHQHKFSPTRLLLAAPHAKDRVGPLEEIGKVINTLKPYKITKDRQASDLILYLFRPEKSASHGGNFRRDSTISRQPPHSNKNAELKIWILDKNGFLYQNNLRHSYSRKGLAALRRNLLELARIKDIIRMAGSPKASPLKITVTPMIPLFKKEDIRFKCIPNPRPTETCASEEYKPLEPLPLSEFLNKSWDLCTIIHFDAENPTGSTYYFYVVYIGKDGEIVPLFPSLEDSSKIAEVKPGSKTVRGKASIRLDTKTLDHYKLVVCRKPINYNLFFQSGVKRALKRVEKLHQLKPLERIFLDATAGTRNRVSYETGSWYAETVSIDMRF
jgi:hypothetical protein